MSSATRLESDLPLPMPSDAAAGAGSRTRPTDWAGVMAKCGWRVIWRLARSEVHPTRILMKRVRSMSSRASAAMSRSRVRIDGLTQVLHAGGRGWCVFFYVMELADNADARRADFVDYHPRTLRGDPRRTELCRSGMHRDRAGVGAGTGAFAPARAGIATSPRTSFSEWPREAADIGSSRRGRCAPIGHGRICSARGQRFAAGDVRSRQSVLRNRDGKDRHDFPPSRRVGANHWR